MDQVPHRGSLFVIFLTVAIDLLGFGIVLPLLPIYAREFALDESGWQLGLLMASYSTMQFLFAPFWGQLSDRIGRRPVLMVGLLGSVLFYTAFGIATVRRSLVLLFVSRVGAGIAGATIPTAQAYIADTTTVQRRTKGMALIGIAFGVGLTFGPLLGFLAIGDESTRPGPWPGYVAAALSAVALLMAVFWLPESHRPGASTSTHRWINTSDLRVALSLPSIGLLLLAIFVCMFSFANFETTIALLVSGGEEYGTAQFDFTRRQVFLTFAYIGLTLAMVQGGLVRRLAMRMSEGKLAVSGAVLELIGFGATVAAIQAGSTPGLLFALGLVVAGFAFMQPSLQSLLSRRSDPARQGAVLGVGQSINSLARILGSGLGIPLLSLRSDLPYVVATALMVGCLLLVVVAVRGGRDFS